MLIPNKLNVTYKTILPDSRRLSETKESNTVNTEILSYSVMKEIRADKTTVFNGENVRNTVTITNNSTAKLFGNFFTISQPNGASFVAGSVKINGTEHPSYNPLNGFYLPELCSNEAVVIEYVFKANKFSSVPATHFASLRYSVNDPSRGEVNFSENTDTVSFTIVNKALEATIRTFNYFDKRRYLEDYDCCCNDDCYC